MTSPAIPAKKDRWLLAIGYGLVAEIATILKIIAGGRAGFVELRSRRVHGGG